VPAQSPPGPRRFRGRGPSEGKSADHPLARIPAHLCCNKGRGRLLPPGCCNTRPDLRLSPAHARRSARRGGVSPRGGCCDNQDLCCKTPRSGRAPRPMCNTPAMGRNGSQRCCNAPPEIPGVFATLARRFATQIPGGVAKTTRDVLHGPVLQPPPERFATADRRFATSRRAGVWRGRSAPVRSRIPWSC
jgi:hypothetical protein